MIRKLPFLLLILLLSGCGGEAPSISQPAAQVTFTSFPTAMAVLVTDTPQPTPLTTQAAAPTPTAPAEPSATNTLPPKSAIQSQQAGFQDCARTPGLGKCDPQAPASLTGMIAFADGQANRLVTVDLATGAGWQAPLLDEGKRGLSQLYWSPKGDRLMGFFDPGIYTVWGRDGAVLQNGTAENNPPAWQPDNSLSLDGTVVSADGRAARLEAGADTSWHLLVTDKPGEKARNLPITQPTDQIYSLREWVPGTGQLLAQVFYASNSAMLVGGGLATIDAENGAIKPMDAIAPLLPGGSFTWNPQNKTLLAFLRSGGNVMTARTIGLLDFATGQLRIPLTDQLSVTGLAWSPDGQRLAFAAAPIEDTPADVKKIFPGPGIYQFDPQTGKVSTVLQSPMGATDGWLQWTPDGKALLYARSVGTDTGSPTEVRLHPMDSGVDRVLINGLAAPQGVPDPTWYSILAYTPAQP